MSDLYIDNNYEFFNNNKTLNLNDSIVASAINTSTRNITTVIEEETVVNVKPIICLVCGRKLKDPKSRILGMGPSCYQHYKKMNNKPFNLLTRKGV